MDRQEFFRTALAEWHKETNNRQLPWKQEKDPYKIWLSEIILQQTRALQGLPYYLSFINAYPTIGELAAASDEEVYKLWQGLGYYNRCKNMLITARLICDQYNGIFPNTYNEIINLKGIGPYTAAAIASFAYNLPVAVLDGNVYRVLARYQGIDEPIDSTAGKRLFTTLTDDFVDKKESAAYNQAIMDFGATVCTPQKPDCASCPLARNCLALRDNLVNFLPVKQKKVKVTTRYFNYIIFSHNGAVWLKKRSDKDIWQNLFEPYLIETEREASKGDLFSNLQQYHQHFTNLEFAGNSRQRLTHRVIDARFYLVHCASIPSLPADGVWVKGNDLKNFAQPKTVTDWLKANLLSESIL